MGFIAQTFVALASASFLFPSIAALTFGFPYGSQKVRGVNLGGWLVLEVYYDPNFLETSNLLSYKALDYPFFV
jgi:glucan 1,3-beta-glucosidase